MEFECCLYFFSYLSKSTNIENRLQIRPILYSSQPIRLQIFFRVSDNTSFSSFSTFCVFCFELHVLNQDINICVIIIKRSSCYVILSSLYKNSGSSHRKSSMEKLLLKIWQYSQENNCVGVSF